MEHRAFSNKIVESDSFLSLPLTTQVLYFHIGLKARDKGLLNNIYSIARQIGCEEKDIILLKGRGYIKEIAAGEYEIVHWYENNGIGDTAKKRNSYKYRQWRKAVIDRDKKCVKCGSTENLVAHHIKSFAYTPLLRTELNNGQTLCENCHRKLHKELRRNGSQMDKVIK